MTFIRKRAGGPTITFSFEGRRIEAQEGDTVASALIAAGIEGMRSTFRNNKERLPYCMMGVCFDCLVQIDGEPDQQSCMVELCDGMEVKRNDIAPEVSS
jgi:predicted molibdopterin-dependent oxidoreductase YjgC